MNSDIAGLYFFSAVGLAILLLTHDPDRHTLQLREPSEPQKRAYASSGLAQKDEDAVVSRPSARMVGDYAGGAPGKYPITSDLMDYLYSK